MVKVRQLLKEKSKAELVQNCRAGEIDLPVDMADLMPGPGPFCCP